MNSKEIAEKAKRYKELDALIKTWEQEKEELRQELTHAMEEAHTQQVQADMYTIRYIPVTTTRLDTKKLKAELENIYNMYTVNTISNRFTII